MRPSKYGNPYRVGDLNPETGEPMTAADAVELFERHTLPNLDLAPLVGLDLICGCDLDKPCHADAIIKHIQKELE